MTIIPAIDIKDGQAVRLVKGAYDTAHQVAADPSATAREFALAGVGLIHVVDLDAARDARSDNAPLIAAIVAAARPAKVELGGGLRCMDDLKRAENLGVSRFIIGSAAVRDPGFVREAVAEYGDRIVVGIDARGGRVRTDGWTRDSGLNFIELAQKMESLGVKTLIVTDIDTDGTLEGPSLEMLRTVKSAVSCEIVASGGVGRMADLRAVAEAGLDGVIVGKALYAGKVDLHEAMLLFESPLARGGLIPVVIQDSQTREVLMLGYTNLEAYRRTRETGTAWFWSRSRQKLWNKGETSGHFLHVERILPDCDSDTLLYLCRPAGPTCHTGHQSCFFREIEPRKYD